MSERQNADPRLFYPYADEVVRFEPIRHIGSGGSGAEVFQGLYYCRDATGGMVGKEAAIKYRTFSSEEPLTGIEPSDPRANETLVRFIGEVSCVRDAGRHPNIMQILDYEVDTEGDQIVVAMPHYGGGRLNQRMGAPMAVEEAMLYATQIGSALQHLHDNNIVHRDVKPSNLLFANDGRLVLTDFDIAGRINDLGYREKDGRKVVDGTPDYIAPEQASGKNIEPASDQYALAALMYQMVTGSTVFRGTQDEVMDGHASGSPDSFEVRMGGYVPALAQAIEPCIRKALEKEPAQRYASVSELTDAMQDAITQQKERMMYADPILQYGLHAAMRGEVVAAHEYFTYAIATDPSNITARYMNAMALERLGKTTEAQEAYAALQEVVPRSYHELAMKGHAAAATGNIIKAIKQYRTALALEDDPDLRARMVGLQDQIRAEVGENAPKGVMGRIWSWVRSRAPKKDTTRKSLSYYPA